ncbi:MFS transporter [Longispora sp. NPDC051575]|uniref:MFS transporter n=1 Tax=Longispora sp. NPDC051575 TaxID=3154943 RepID=UPI00341F0177
MYLATSRSASPTTPGGAGPARVSGTVVGLGLVSFFTDASSELVAAFLPVYLLYGLGIGYLQFGVLDGLYTGATAVLRLAGGHLADRTARPRAVALFGYGLSAVTKLGFPLVGGSVAGIGGLLAADRAGKGIRTAPRDAMITAASPRAALGRAFGVHRALDTAGALLGPLLAFALLAGIGSAYDAVFGTSFCLALIGVLILFFFVRVDPPAPVTMAPPGTGAGDPAVTWPGADGGVPAVARPGAGQGDPAARRGGAPARPRVTLRGSLALLRNVALRRVAGCALLLGLATAGDAFLFVTLAERSGIGGNALSLMPLGTAATFLLAAIPVGRLADRLGRWRVFLAGQALLVAGYALLAGPLTGWALLPVVLGLHGLYYAATDGVLMAHVGALLPPELRSTGLALVQTGQALARMAAAVAFGALAQGWALRPAFTVFAAALLVATVASAVVHRTTDREYA